MVYNWDRAWRRYATLGIPKNKEDGSGFSAMTRSKRRTLEHDYRKLDKATREAKEVALARFAPFCLRKDGTLDYHTGHDDGSSCMLM